MYLLSKNQRITQMFFSKLYNLTYLKREYISLFHKWTKKQGWTGYTAKGLITVLHSQSHRCPDKWNISIVIQIVQASVSKKSMITFQWVFICFNDTSDHSEWVIQAIRTPVDVRFQCDSREFLGSRRGVFHFPVGLDEGTERCKSSTCLSGS